MSGPPSDPLLGMLTELRDSVPGSWIPSQLKKLSEFRGGLPGSRNNAHPHPTTLVRHVVRGVRLPDGTRLRLRAVRVGSTWLTTDEWFAEFVAAVTAAHAPAPTTGPRTPGERARASHAAEARLKDLGL